jgi:hypothetical protein
MRAVARNAARDQYGLKDGLNRVATLHFVEVLILSPNSWKIESAKSPTGSVVIRRGVPPAAGTT